MSRRRAARTSHALRTLLVTHAVSDHLQSRVVLARALRRAGHDVQVVVPEEREADALDAEFPLHRVPLRRTSVRLRDEGACCLALTALYRRLRPALVYHVGVKPTLHGGIAARLAGVPAVIGLLTGLGHLFTAEDAGTRRRRALVRLGLRAACGHPNHRLVFQNAADRARLVAERVVRAEETRLIRGSGVDADMIAPTPEPSGTVVVLMVARLLWEKGVREFVEAARLLRSSGRAVRCVLVGAAEADHPSAVPTALLRQWHGRGDVEWLGWRDDVPALLARSHVLCLPTAYGEGSPRAVLEAMAAGRAVVATDTPGCRELIRDGESGVLVAPGDPVALAAAIVRVATNAPLRARLARAARARVEREFALRHVLDANLVLTRELTEGMPVVGDAPEWEACGSAVTVGHP